MIPLLLACAGPKADSAAPGETAESASPVDSADTAPDPDSSARDSVDSTPDPVDSDLPGDSAPDTAGTADTGVPGSNLDGDEPRIYGEWELAQVGTGVSGDHDADGDGAPDVLVTGLGLGNTLGAWLFYGPIAGAVGVRDAPVTFRGGSAYSCGYPDCLGTFAGDVNGDGLDDVLLGLPQAEDYFGAAYVMYAPFDEEVNVANADVTLVGEEAFDQAGYALAAGEMDGDGLADVLIGAPGDVTGWTYLVPGPGEGAGALAASTVAFRGVATAGEAGTIVENAGDRNGDGLDDVLIGTQGRAGTVFLVDGPFTGVTSLWDADATVEVPYLSSAANAGDLDGDGRPELVVGDVTEDGVTGGPGYACVFSGALTGTVDRSAAIATFEGDEIHRSVGRSVHTAGDVDADGSGDVFVGAFYEGYYTDGIEGALGYVIRGPVSGTLAVTDGHLPFTAFGGSYGSGEFRASLAGDIDGDGRTDLLLGDSWENERGRAAGAVWPILATEVP